MYQGVPVEVALHLKFLFTLLSAVFCALSIDDHQRIFKRIAVSACVISGALMIADAIVAAMAAMAVAVGTLFLAVFLAIRWQCTVGLNKSHDHGGE